MLIVAAISSGANSPWTRAEWGGDLERVSARGDLLAEVGVRSGAMAGDQCDTKRNQWHGHLAVGVDQAFGLESTKELFPIGAESTQRELRVDRGHIELDLTTRNVHLDRTPNSHLDAILDSDGIAGSFDDAVHDLAIRVEQRDGDRSLGLRAGSDRVDQIEVDMAARRTVDVANLTLYPDLWRKCSFDGLGEPARELTDRKRVVDFEELLVGHGG